LAESRLATLTGFGGVGKTRLAVEVAHELAGSYRDGAWFIDLAGTRDPEVIVGLVASTLGLKDPAAAGSAAALGERCRDKVLLLVLDNCEHLKKACVVFATTVLRAAPGMRILATSRESLEAPEELVVPLAPFVVPHRCEIVGKRGVACAGDQSLRGPSACGDGLRTRRRQGRGRHRFVPPGRWVASWH